MIEPGKILIAKPYLQDNYFKRTVIYIVEHNENGCLGFILNKPNDLLLKDIFQNFKNGNFPLYEGGPVSNNQLFYTHTLGLKLSDSIEITNGVYWGGNFLELIDMIEKGLIGDNEIRFYIGYSGWDTEQLNAEIRKDMWINAPFNYNDLIKSDESTLWSDELIKINPSYKAFSDFTFDPSLN